MTCGRGAGVVSGCPALAARLSADNRARARLIHFTVENQIFVPNFVAGTGIAQSKVQDFPPFIGDMIMKLETLMLQGLFVACLAVSALIFGAMVTTTPASLRLAAGSSVGAILLTAPTSCALPPDGVVCPQIGG